MVQTTEHGRRAHLTDGLYSARYRRVPIERLVRPRPVVVLDVLPHHSQQMLSPERDDVIRAVAAYRTDDALDERVLPRRPWRRPDLVDLQRVDHAVELAGSENSIVAWRVQEGRSRSWRSRYSGTEAAPIRRLG